MALKSLPIILLLIFGSGCAHQKLYMLKNMEEFRTLQATWPLKKIAEKSTLSLAEAQNTALANNPTYLAAYQAVRAAKYRYYRSLSAYLPGVQGNLSVMQSLRSSRHIKNPPAGIMPGENYFSGETTLQASWLIFDGFEREFSVLIARAGFDKSLNEDANARRLLLQAVAFAYYDIMLAEARKVIARADLEFQESALKQAENRYRFGKTSMAAVLNFKILGNEARSAILSASARVKTGRYALAALMGEGVGHLPENIKLDQLEISEPFELKSLETYCNMAIARRSDLAAARNELQISRYCYWQGYAKFLPTIKLFYSLEFSNNNFRYTGYRHNAARYNHLANSYGATVQWNLFEGFANYNLLRELNALESVKQYALLEKFLQVINEVSDARENILNASGQLELYRQSLEWVFEQRQIVQSEYNSARTTITRLNGAQSDLVKAENMLAIAQIELNKAIVQLQTAIGGDTSGMPYHQITLPATAITLDKLLQKLKERSNRSRHEKQLKGSESPREMKNKGFSA